MTTETMAPENKTNLIVNYLPQTLTDEDFRTMFAAMGPLNASKIVRDHNTGYSYGFGFVDYVTEEDALKAINELNGQQLQNKRIKVAYSRSGEQIKGANLYLKNIPKTMTQAELEELFTPHGAIIQCRILTDQATGSSKGVGFVLYHSRAQAQSAINALDGYIPPGSDAALNVKFAEENRGKARAPGAMVPARGGYNGGTPGFNAFQGGYNTGGGAGPGPMRGNQRNYRFNPMNTAYGAGNANGGMGNGTNAIQTLGGAGNTGFVLFVYNICPDTDERELWQLFSPYGLVTKVNVIRDGQKRGKGYGFVTMNTCQEAVAAIQNLNGYKWAQGKPLQVSFKASKA